MTTPETARNTRIALGVLFAAAGIAHFTKRDFFDQRVPASLAPYRTPIDVVTGGHAGGRGGHDVHSSAAGGGAVDQARAADASLLPAVNQIRHPETLRQAGIPPQLAPVRVAAQLLVIAAT